MSGPFDRVAGAWRTTRRVGARTVQAWLDDNLFHWGAAIAYYSVVSLAPLVVLAMTVLGQVVGSEVAERRILAQVELLAGPRGAEVASTVLEEASRPELGSLGAVLTMALLLFGATAVFANFQSALNRIWSVEPRSGVVRNMLRTRLAAFLMVLALGGLMVVSVVVGTTVGWVGPIFAPLQRILPIVQLADLATSLLLIWLFVGAVFWVLPDVKISWRDVSLGALVTAALLVLGKFLLTSFLARNAFASMYGTAGSIFLLLLWVYYSAQVFFLGAEFTQVWSEARGRRIQPESYAVRVEKVRARPRDESGTDGVQGDRAPDDGARRGRARPDEAREPTPPGAGDAST